MVATEGSFQHETDTVCGVAVQRAAAGTFQFLRKYTLATRTLFTPPRFFLRTRQWVGQKQFGAREVTVGTARVTCNRPVL